MYINKIIIIFILLTIFALNIYSQNWEENELTNYLMNKPLQKGIVSLKEKIWVLTTKRLVKYENDKLETFLLDSNSKGPLEMYKHNVDDFNSGPYNYWNYIIGNDDTICLAKAGGHDMLALFLIIKKDTVYRYLLDYDTMYYFNINNIFYDDSNVLWVHLTFLKKNSNAKSLNTDMFNAIYFFRNNKFTKYFESNFDTDLNFDFFTWDNRKFVLLYEKCTNNYFFKLCEIIDGRILNIYVLDCLSEKYEFTNQIIDSILYVYNKENHLYIYNLFNNSLIKKDFSNYTYHASFQRFCVLNNNIYFSDSKGFYSINLSSEKINFISLPNKINNCEILVNYIDSDKYDHIYFFYNWVFVNECKLSLSILNINRD